MKTINKKGFTLIELMIVISIIAILAAIAPLNFISYRSRAEDTAVKMLLAEIGSLEREYRAENGVYIACPLTPSQRDGAWQSKDPWKDLSFRPMQPLYGYQLKVEAAEDTFIAVAIKDGKEVFFASNVTYDITERRPVEEKD
jgi:prepilin-type N-terminal cleavage/methylation domain-containing protein